MELNIYLLSEHDLTLLYQLEHEAIRDELLKDSRTPASVIESWFPVATPYQYRLIASHPNTPIPLLQLLLGFHDSSYGECIASNIATPVTMLDELSRHSDPEVRYACAANPSLSGALADLLSSDRNQNVRLQAASHACLSVERMIDLVNESITRRDDDFKVALLANPSLPAALLYDLFHSTVDSDVLAHISAHSNTPSDLLSSLADVFRWPSQEAKSLRLSIAKHPSCPSDLLIKFARSPQTPPDLLASLAKSSRSISVRQTLLNNPHTPASTKITLSLQLATNS